MTTSNELWQGGLSITDDGATVTKVSKLIAEDQQTTIEVVMKGVNLSYFLFQILYVTWCTVTYQNSAD